MNKMKHYRRFLLLLAMLPVGTFAKDNFKMTGKIDGVGNDTLCIEYVILQPQKQIVKRKIVVKNGEFSFSAKLHDAYMGLMHLKSKPQETLYTYFVPDEEAIFSGRLNSVEEHWSGSTFISSMNESQIYSVLLTLNLLLPETSQTAFEN